MSGRKDPVILVVDDDEAGRYITCRELRRAGFSTAEAVTGAEALARSRENPDLVVLDIHLPDMDGFEVCRRIKGDPETRHLPVIHLSATAIDPGQRACGLESGADAYLVQPVDPRELAASIRAMLRSRETERLLRESEARYRALSQEFNALLDAIPDQITLQDTEFRIVWANQAMLAAAGRDAASVIGETCHRIRHGIDRRIDDCPLAVTARTGKPAETVMRTPGGRIHEIRTVPLLDERGQVSRVIEVVRDITEHRSVEEQLRQAQKMESVGRLAGGVAHDFNNMLNVILGHAEMTLERGDLAPQVEASLREIVAAARRSAALTQQLLAFARRQPVSPQTLDLNEAVSGMINMLRRLIGENIVLSWEPGPPPATVHIDPSQIDQILANLVVNARDAIGDSGGKIAIHTWNDEKGRVALSVADDGCGMSDEVRERIFEPFFTTKSPGLGTGLGLATVHGIVNQNGGSIEVESAPGKGSRFIVRLPAVRGGAAAALESAVPAPRAKPGETILLVEDEKPLLELTRDMLERLGYTVLIAAGAEEALLIAGEVGRIDLLVTDVVMPDMSGRRLAERLTDLRPGLLTLFVSGYNTEVVAVSGVIGRGLRFLQKPFSQRRLAVAIREALDAGR